MGQFKSPSGTLIKSWKRDDILLKFKLLLFVFVLTDWIGYVGGALEDKLILCDALTQQCPCRREVVSLARGTDISRGDAVLEISKVRQHFSHAGDAVFVYCEDGAHVNMSTN